MNHRDYAALLAAASGLAISAAAPAQTGACCEPFGTCSVRTAAGCTSVGGLYAGDNSACATANCPPTGACCRGTLSCDVMWQTQCVAFGGVYHGDGTGCTTEFCASPADQSYITTPDLTATFSPTWIEDPAFPHNNNGVLEPGESALILCDFIIVYPNGNASVTFSPPFAGYSSGLVYGFSDLHVGVTSTSGDAAGVYNGGITQPPSNSIGPNSDGAGATGYGVKEGWRFNENIANGRPGANGFVAIIPATGSTDPQSANSENPATNLLRLGWTPASYAPRTQTFSVHPTPQAGAAAVGLLVSLDYENSLGMRGYLPFAQVTFGSVNIPIAGGSPPSCYPNCDSSTTTPLLNVADFTCFLQKFAAAEAYANCDQSTAAPALNVADFTCFLQKFAAGCR